MHSLLGLSGKLPTVLLCVHCAMARRLAKVPGVPKTRRNQLQLGAFLGSRPWGAWYSFDGSLGSPGLACQKLSWIFYTWIETCSWDMGNFWHRCILGGSHGSHVARSPGLSTRPVYHLQSRCVFEIIPMPNRTSIWGWFRYQPFMVILVLGIVIDSIKYQYQYQLSINMDINIDIGY